LPHELAIVILHTAEKKAVASHHAERTPSGPPSRGIQAEQAAEGVANCGVGRHWPPWQAQTYNGVWTEPPVAD